MRFPGRIPFAQHLWQCLKQYCIFETEFFETEWEVVDRPMVIDMPMIEETWGHYDDDTREWITL